MRILSRAQNPDYRKFIWVHRDEFEKRLAKIKRDAGVIQKSGRQASQKSRTLWRVRPECGREDRTSGLTTLTHDRFPGPEQKQSIPLCGLSDCSLLHTIVRNRSSMARELVWLENSSFAAWGRSACNWITTNIHPTQSGKPSEAAREAFDKHECAKSPRHLSPK